MGMAPCSVPRRWRGWPMLRGSLYWKRRWAARKPGIQQADPLLEGWFESSEIAN